MKEYLDKQPLEWKVNYELGIIKKLIELVVRDLNCEHLKYQKNELLMCFESLDKINEYLKGKEIK